MRQCVVDMGAVLKTPRTYENNITYDTAEGRLRQGGRLLRLRRDRRNVLTYKEPLPREDADFKVRQEFEVEVSDSRRRSPSSKGSGSRRRCATRSTARRSPVRAPRSFWTSCRWETSWEIEATREQIRAITAAVGLDFADRLRGSYGDILEAVCARTPCR